MTMKTRRAMLRDLGVSAASLPFLMNLPSLGQTRASASVLSAAASTARASTLRKQRLVFVFSPNGIVPDRYWPDQTGSHFDLKPILEPLAPFQDRMLVIKGLADLIRGDGDSHMRGMSCLLTGIELFPGNIQGGSHTPAGWASGISIDQELKRFLQGREETRTRFGSLELGVHVPDRADPWTRWVYAGPNKPIAPIDDPYQMFAKLYGRMKDRAALTSILDTLQGDLNTVRNHVGTDDRRLLDDHQQMVRELEQEMARMTEESAAQDVPVLPEGIKDVNDNMPWLSKMQIDLMVNSFVNDMTRIATLQYTNSVGGTRMTWLGIDENHHGLSHEPDKNLDAQDKLTQINIWFCQQVAYLAQRLDAIPEPGGEGTMLDNTTIVWTNELGKGNSHTLNDVPMVIVGGGMGFQMGRALQLARTPHNRLHLAFAHAMGLEIPSFGKPELCEAGPLELS